MGLGIYTVAGAAAEFKITPLGIEARNTHTKYSCGGLSAWRHFNVPSLMTAALPRSALSTDGRSCRGSDGRSSGQISLPCRTSRDIMHAVPCRFSTDYEDSSMNRTHIAISIAVFALGAAALPARISAQVADTKPLPVALVDALTKLSGGPHKGFRANHAKGIMVEGTFTPTAKAPSLSKAPHFAKPVPVVVRFSDTTGVPTLPDADPAASPHGMASASSCRTAAAPIS